MGFHIRAIDRRGCLGAGGSGWRVGCRGASRPRRGRREVVVVAGGSREPSPMPPQRGMRSIPRSRISNLIPNPMRWEEQERVAPASAPLRAAAEQRFAAELCSESCSQPFLLSFWIEGSFQIPAQPNPGRGCQETQPDTSTCRFCTHNTASIAVILWVTMTGRRSSPPEDTILSPPGLQPAPCPGYCPGEGGRGCAVASPLLLLF